MTAINFSELSNAELAQLISDAMAVQAARTHPVKLIRYTESFGAYNARSKSRPWIAKVTSWPVGGRAELAFGSYLGDLDGGEVEIMAMPGDIILYGQKDNRVGAGSNEWAIAQVDGTLLTVDQSEARAAWKIISKLARISA